MSSRSSRRARRRGRDRCGKAGALVVGTRDGLVVAVLSDDTGITVAFDDAPAEPKESEFWWACLHCLAEHHPEAVEGIAMARRHGLAECIDGKWEPHSLEDIG